MSAAGMDFAEFISPMPVETFRADYFGHRPAHIRGPSQRGALLSMQRLQELMGVLPHWTEHNIKLILNSRPVHQKHFMEQGRADQPPRADPAKVQLFLRMGSSFVGDHIEDIDPFVREAAAMLANEFAGAAGANAYCSFKGIRAFNSHCDLHEVFAVQLEGEKVWQIYENRADTPVEALEGENAQALIDLAKGAVMMTVRMQPGDLLYIPRGYFHDALADSSASLHLTFGIRPLDGRYVFRLLEELARSNPKFRAYLPDGRAEAVDLRAHLEALAGELSDMLRSPLFEDKLRNSQRALAMRTSPVDLQDRRKLDYYAATGASAQVVPSPGGATLRFAGGEEPVGLLAEAAEWTIGQTAFSRQQVRAQFPWLLDGEIDALLTLLERTRLIASYEPEF